MTDLASQATAGGDTEDSLAHQNILPGCLPLPGDGQTMVYVIRVPNVLPATAAFGLHQSGNFYTGGITWANRSRFAKFVIFHVLRGVERVYCDQLPYADVKSQHQQLAILATSPASYSFTVKFTDGEPHDPQIVVTLPSLPEPTA
jgi:hypothetical protein